MGSIVSLSDLVNRLTGGNNGSPESVFVFKNSRIQSTSVTTFGTAGFIASHWMNDGYPGSGAVPGAAAIPTRTTQGAIPITNAGGGRTKYLHTASISSSQLSSYIIYDRLYHTTQRSGGSALDATLTTEQTLSTAALTRYTDGVGNIAFVEIYGTSLLGTTETTITMKYTNQAGTQNQVGQAVRFGGTSRRSRQQILMLPCASGDTGIQQVQSVTLAGTTGTAGNWGITVGHPLAYIGIPQAGGGSTRTYAQELPGMVEVKEDACLSILYLINTTTLAETTGFLTFVEA